MYSDEHDSDDSDELEWDTINGTLNEIREHILISVIGNCRVCDYDNGKVYNYDNEIEFSDDSRGFIDFMNDDSIFIETLEEMETQIKDTGIVKFKGYERGEERIKVLVRTSNVNSYEISYC